jgi:hypothetical protein
LTRWRDAVWAAVRREAGRHGGAFTRQQLIDNELDWIRRQTGSVGRTPEQTLSRELQELRESGLLLFDGNGRYRLDGATAREPDADKAIATQVERRLRVRLGQGRFRRALMERWGARCPLTGIGEPGLLVASHIIAWHACPVEKERVEPENGLLLSALWDAAFDRGLVSFADDGAVITYRGLGEAARGALRVEGVPRLDRLSPGNRERLAVHRAYCAAGDWPTP